ncbi:MAG: hypothetical protein HKN60_10205 [Rhizobiales bacterium]|nr:hypothetical protein [Hyphomicrobiales bacterium]
MVHKAHLPDQVPVDAYGNHGFRFGGMSHQGSILALPSGMYGWAVNDIIDLRPDDLSQVFEDRDRIGFVILGTGKTQVWPTPELRQDFDQRRIGLEVMDTGAAVRTYNVLLAEKRPVAAALVSVDDPR